MSDHPHSHAGHDHDHDHATPETSVDAGSQALAEALGSSFAIVKVVMVVLFLVFLGSGFFQVRPDQRAIILRFANRSVPVRMLCWDRVRTSLFHRRAMKL